MRPGPGYDPEEYDPDRDPNDLGPDPPEAEARDLADADRDELHELGYDEECDRA